MVEHENSITDKLYAIFSHYSKILINPEIEKVQVYRIVAGAVSDNSDRDWSWRYIQSIMSGTVKPSRFIADAIDRTYKTINGETIYIPAPACKSCGDAPSVCLCDGTKTYDPTTERVTAKPGTGRKRHRAEIYPGTAPADVIAKLAALGHYVEYRKETE